MFGTEDWGIVALGGVASLIGNILYMLGGTQGFGLFWRRFVGSFIIATSASLIAIYFGRWSWPLIFIYPALVGGFALPYGANTFWEKFVKRFIFALGCCMAGFFGMWATGFTAAGIGIFIFQIVIGSGSVYLGTKNPYDHATLEQFLICNLLTMTVPFWGFIN